LKKRLIIILFIIIFILAGCWDQQLLVDKTLINGISLDITEEGKILSTSRALNIQSKGGGQFEIADEIVEAVRPTVVGLGIDFDSQIAGQIDISKAHIVIIGEELAKKGLHPLVELFFRSKDSYLSSKVLISKGKASDILAIEKEKSPIAFVILQTLNGAEADTVIPNETIFTVWKTIIDIGEDMVLPYVERVKTNKIEVAGVALFNDDKFTGTTLSREKSSLLLLLLDKLQKTSRMALVLDTGRKDRSISFVTRDLKRNLEVKVKKPGNQITSSVHIKMNVEVLAYPQDFKKELNIKELNKELSEELTKQAKEITNTLIKSDCDAFGIGRRIKSFHPDLWKKINWQEEYKKVHIEPKVTVNIIKTGNLY
jgi:Ger(x)C family germination protein